MVEHGTWTPEAAHRSPRARPRVPPRGLRRLWARISDKPLFDQPGPAQKGSAPQRFTRRNRLPEEPTRAVWIKGQIEEEVSGHESQEAHDQKGEHEQDDAGPSLIPE